ncbi:VanZ family protein [Niallia sp. Krafla_26]|uniref:VanZ family protein n=1 Tax=Niallia sp. Krafla_26 TaxID=3064703 RepID=UPI003D181670
MELEYSLVFGIDKQMHFFSYALISFVLGMMVILISKRKSIMRNICLLWMILIAIGTIEEYRQYLLPNRSAEFLDAIANILGVTIGLAFPSIILMVIIHRHHFMTKLLSIYGIMMIPLLIGLLYMNERPFLTLKEPVKIKLKTLVAMIGL